MSVVIFPQMMFLKSGYGETTPSVSNYRYERCGSARSFLMNHIAPDVQRRRAGQFFLIAGYFCVVALLCNVFARLHWFNVHLPGLDGFGARWKWALSAAVCFVLAWYLERLESRRPT